MTRNSGPDDGGVITRPGRRALHMPRSPQVDPRAPAHERNAVRVVTDPELGRVIGDLSQVIKTMVPRVLGTRTYVLDAQGTATDQYRVPYACLSVISESAAKLTVASSPLQGAAPGAGSGQGRVPANGFAVLNLAGNAWAVYGGAAGELITVTAYTQPQPPAAARLV